MIRFADERTAPLVREMWRECFGDSEEFMDMYFSRKYRNEDTLLYILDGKPVASLQMHPYRMTFYGVELGLYYLSGICALPPYRGRGFASALIMEAHRESGRRGVPLTVLKPASAELYGYYAKFGYAKVFESGSRPIPLGEILDSSSGIAEAYSRFDAIYRGVDFCVQKTLDDFVLIAADYTGDGRPVKTDIGGMAYSVDHMPLLRIYAGNNPEFSFTIHVEAAEDSPEAFHRIAGGNVIANSGSLTDGTVVTADKRSLTGLLFGYKTSALPEPYCRLFPEHHPVMNLMLE